MGKYLPGLWLVTTITAVAYGLDGFGLFTALSLIPIGIFLAAAFAILPLRLARGGPT